MIRLDKIINDKTKTGTANRMGRAWEAASPEDRQAFLDKLQELYAKGVKRGVEP